MANKQIQESKMKINLNKNDKPSKILEKPIKGIALHEKLAQWVTKHQNNSKKTGKSELTYSFT